MSEESEKISIRIEAHHALNMMAFLSQFNLDDQEATYLKNSVKEFSDQVYLNVTKEMVDDASLKVKFEIMLGNAPNENIQGKKIV